jgi:lysophospholipase L1-like esterase
VLSRPAAAEPRFTARRSLLLASIVVVAVLGGAELIARAAGVAPRARPALVVRSVDVDIEFPFMRADSELFWSPRPGFHGEFLGRPVTINALGLRGPEIEVPKPQGRRRIACFGDSITFGYGVGDEETYAFTLGQRLAGEDVDVVNAGVTGYTTYQVLRLLRRVAPALQMDVATFCVGWNDASRRPVDDRTYAGRIRAVMALEGVARHVYLYRAMQNLYARWIVRRAEREWAAPPEAQRDPPDQYRQNLQAIVGECRARGVQPVFLELPRRRRPGEAPPVSPHAQAFREEARRMDVPFIDIGDLGLDSAPGPNAQYFLDSLHLTPEGHRYLADLLAGELRARGLARRAP